MSARAHSPDACYKAAVSGTLPILIGIAMAATLGVLILGVFTMARGGAFHARNSNRLMRLRVALQLVAILLFAAFMLLNR